MNVRIVEHGTNRGVGAAFRTGFQHCVGDFVCTIDADCTYSPEGLKALLDALASTGADIAVASPYHPKGWRGRRAVVALVLSRRCSALYRWASPLKLYTYTSIFRAYRAEVIRNVPFSSDGFVSAAEILLAAGRQGYRVTEVPMILTGALHRPKQDEIFRTIRSHLRMLAGFATGIARLNSRQTTNRLPREKPDTSGKHKWSVLELWDWAPGAGT